MKHLKFISFFVLILNFTATAQKYELGKVSVAELEQKAHPIDTSAVAAVLFNKGISTFRYQKEGFYEIHEYSFRIKIYKKEGLSWANLKVPYYTGYKEINNDVVKFSDCVTYNLENGNIVKTKMKNEGSFDTKINDKWSEASITLPNVKVGSVIEYKYTIKSENVVKFPLFNFQYSIPVNYAEYKTEIPEFYIYSSIQSGFQKINSDVKVGFGYQNYADEHNQSLNMSYQQINSIHIAENLPALKEEEYVDNLQNYRSAIDYELQKTRFPEVPEKIFTQTWEDVSKTIYKDKEFGTELEKRGYFETSMNMILANATTDVEKATAILKFVQNKMNWNKKRSYYTESGVVKAFETETGNDAEINFILISMLNRAQINTYPVLVSTVDNGVPVYPNRTVFNYVIAAAEIDGKKVLMDATNKYTTFDILPLEDLNWTGRLIRKDNPSEEINLVPKTPSKQNSNMMVTIDEKGSLKGKVRIQKTDYEAYCFRTKYAETNKDNYLEKLENNFNQIQIDNYSIENMNTDLSKPVIETFNFISNNHSEVIGGKIYINPLSIFTETKNPFLQEKRELPIYFGYPIQKKIQCKY